MSCSYRLSASRDTCHLFFVFEEAGEVVEGCHVRWFCLLRPKKKKKMILTSQCPNAFTIEWH